MKKTKEQKGITLVALIITIILLLILAMVAIKAVQGDGIIAHAKNARDKHNEAQIEENEKLAGYITKIEENVPSESVKVGGWIQNKTEVKNSKTGQEIEVGDIVTNYSEEGYKGEWSVLGVENGNLLLTTTTNATRLTLVERTTGLEELKTVCENYGKGNGSAGLARSIKMEDINRVTGYNIDTADENTKLAGTIGEYGKTFIFSLGENGKVMYSTDGGKTTKDTNEDFFMHPDGRLITSKTDKELIELGITKYKKVNSIEINNSAYAYYITTLTANANDPNVGLSIDSKACKSLFMDSDIYYIASQGIFTLNMDPTIAVGFGLFIGPYYGMVGIFNSWYHSDDYSCGIDEAGVRPVVTLKSDFQPVVK